MLSVLLLPHMNPDAVIADAALQGAEVVGNAVDTAVQNHGTVLSDAVAGLQAAVASCACGCILSPYRLGPVSAVTTAINPVARRY